MYNFILFLTGFISIISVFIFLVGLTISIAIKIGGGDFYENNYHVEFKQSTVTNMIILSTVVSIFVLMLWYEADSKYREFQTHYKVEPIIKETLYKNDFGKYYKDTIYVYVRDSNPNVGK